MTSTIEKALDRVKMYYTNSQDEGTVYADACLLAAEVERLRKRCDELVEAWIEDTT